MPEVYRCTRRISLRNLSEDRVEVGEGSLVTVIGILERSPCWPYDFTYLALSELGLVCIRHNYPLNGLTCFDEISA
jgi:hypothetical protein